MKVYNNEQYIALLEARIDVYERVIDLLMATIKASNEKIKEKG